MSAISLKSITGITSITTPAGVDNQLTLHNNNTTERVKIDVAGNVHINNHLAVAGVVTATTFVGALTGTASGNPTLTSGANNRVVTATGANALTGEANFTYNGTQVDIAGTTDGVLNLDTTDSRGAFIRFGQGGSFHNMVGCADGLVTGLDKQDLAVRATDNFAIATNGDNERLRIDSTGKLGLGMTPDTWHTNNQKVFQISGTNAGLNLFTRAGSYHLSSNFIYNSSDAGVFQAASGYAMHHAVSAANGTFDWLSSSAVSSSAGSSAIMVNRLRIDASGDVKVISRGDNYSGAPFYVAVTGKSSVNYGGGNDDTACLRIVDNGSNNSYYHGIELRAKQSGDARIYVQDKGSDACDLVFATDNSGIAERLRIASSGEISMGGFAPTAGAGVLQIAGGLRIAGSGSASDTNTPYIYRTSGSDHLNFATSGVERLRITSAGKVGIGTNNPTAALDVRDASGSDPTFFVGHSEADVIGEAIRIGRVAPYQTIRYHSIKAEHSGGTTSNMLAFHLHNGSTATSQTEVMRLRGDGEVWFKEGKIKLGTTSGTDNYIYSTNAAGIIYQADENGHRFQTYAGSWLDRLLITDAGTIHCGTSGVLKAVINSSISGHQFISQVDDNNTGFEVYSQHGSTATRSSFTVYANTGSGGAKRTQFVVAGDDRAYFRGDVQPESDGDINFGTDARTWNKMYYRNAYPDQGTEISISGSSFLSSTFYDVGYSTGNMGGIDLNGTYIITCYSDNHQAGGGNYGITYTWIVGIRNQSTNQNTTNEVPLLSVTGHSTNNQLIELRTKRENAVDGGDEFLVWRPQSNLGTIDGSSGKTMKWRVQRIGRSSLG